MASTCSSWSNACNRCGSFWKLPRSGNAAETEIALQGVADFFTAANTERGGKGTGELA